MLRPSEPKRISVQKIISGGQTGADRGGLEAARKLRIDTGGVVPFNYLTEDGPDPTLEQFSGLTVLKKMPIALAYINRSKMNVDMACGTVVFMPTKSPGSDRTIAYCKTGMWRSDSNDVPEKPYRPVHVVTGFSEEHRSSFMHWLASNDIKVLNVAGNRQSRSGVSDFSALVCDFLVTSIKKQD